MANLSVTICGVPFKNPVIAASGTFGFGREFNELYDIGGIGGVSTKGLTLEPRLGNPVPRIAESRGVILNAVGLQNPGVEHFIENDLEWLKSTGTRVIANVAGKTLDDYKNICE
jgi:dihydroorotate dehydrogenase (NAD+) catalytic subunit